MGNVYSDTTPPQPSEVLRVRALKRTYEQSFPIFLGKSRVFLCDNIYNRINSENHRLWIPVSSWCLPEKPMEYLGFHYRHYWV